MLQDLEEEELFAEAQRRHRGPGDASEPLGELLARWRRPALFVIRRIQQSYRRGGEADQEELLQEAVIKLLARGLAQYRGPEGRRPEAGKSAARTFFLRIVKHTAIDHYRRHHEELAEAAADGDAPEVSPAEARLASGRAERQAARDAAIDEYHRAFARLEREHPNEAAAWRLYHHEDLEDHDAVAGRLGISVTNSYKRVSRAQARLRLFLLEQRELERTL